MLLCVCVCVCVCVYKCLNMCVYVCVCLFVCLRLCVFVCLLCVAFSASVRSSVHARVRSCLSVPVREFMRACRRASTVIVSFCFSSCL